MSDFQALMTLLSMIGSIYFGFIIYRNGVKDEGDQNGVMKNKIEFMREQIGVNQEEIKEIREAMGDSKERLIRIEESVKQAHQPIKERL